MPALLWGRWRILRNGRWQISGTITTGEVAHACSDSHTAADFFGFMKVVASENPRIDFHYTSTSASWLNQFEGFFGILTNQSLRATEFLSKNQLRHHIASYIVGWNRKTMKAA